MNSSIKSNTIVFLHGLFVSPNCWNDWKVFFESMGYSCHVVANPYHEGEPMVLRKQIHPALGKVTFKEVVENAASFIDELPESPILIGHSLAGLTVQKLISMGKGAAGICIAGAPPAGFMTTKWSFWKANFTVINFFKGDAVFVPTKKWFHYAFCNTQTRCESDKVFEELAVPESRNIPRSTLKSFAKIDGKLAHLPLLFIAGEKDHIIPASLVKKNFEAYSDTTGITEFKEFPDRDHFMIGEKRWQDVASYIADWIIT